jgi:hypothetical protein
MLNNARRGSQSFLSICDLCKSDLFKRFNRSHYMHLSIMHFSTNSTMMFLGLLLFMAQSLSSMPVPGRSASISLLASSLIPKGPQSKDSFDRQKDLLDTILHGKSEPWTFEHVKALINTLQESESASLTALRHRAYASREFPPVEVLLQSETSVMNGIFLRSCTN